MHLHFICENCHSIMECDDEAFHDLIESLGDTFGIRSIIIKGWCQKCMN